MERDQTVSVSLQLEGVRYSECESAVWKVELLLVEFAVESGAIL